MREYIELCLDLSLGRIKERGQEWVQSTVYYRECKAAMAAKDWETAAIRAREVNALVDLLDGVADASRNTERIVNELLHALHDTEPGL